MNMDDVRRRARELEVELDGKKALLDAGEISAKAYNDSVDAAFEETARLKAMQKAFREGNQAVARQEAAFSGASADFGIKALGEVSGPVAPSAMHIPQADLHGLYDSLKRGQPVRMEIGNKSLANVRDGKIVTKSPLLESGLTGGLGQLPPVMVPNQFVSMGYEPQRLFNHLEQAVMNGPSVAWLQQISNTNEAAGVAENAVKPDLGPVVKEQTAYPEKIAVTGTISMEYLSDFPAFSQYFPTMLQRSVINSESLYLIAATTGSSNAISGGPVNAAFNGWLNTSGTLTRAVGSDTPLDAVSKAFVDLRIQGGFAEADLVVLHPQTWNALRREKDSMGRYLLAPDGPSNFTSDGSPAARLNTQEAPMAVIPQGRYGPNSSIWGVPVVETTMCPAGTGIVASIRAGGGVAWTRWAMMLQVNPWGDTEWTQNQVSYRCEERISLTVPRSQALNILTGLPIS